MVGDDKRKVKSNSQLRSVTVATSNTCFTKLSTKRANLSKMKDAHLVKNGRYLAIIKRKKQMLERKQYLCDVFSFMSKGS